MHFLGAGTQISSQIVETESLQEKFSSIKYYKLMLIIISSFKYLSFSVTMHNYHLNYFQ